MFVQYIQFPCHFLQDQEADFSDSYIFLPKKKKKKTEPKHVF